MESIQKLFIGKISAFIALNMLALSFPVVVYAVDKFVITPRASVSWKTEDNFYNVDTNERRVDTVYFKPGIDIGYETAKSFISLGYTLIYEDYDYKDSPATPEDRARDKNDFTGHSLNFESKTQPFSKLTLMLDGGLVKTRDTSKIGPFGSSEATKVKYTQSHILPGAIYEINRNLSTGLRYKYTDLDYDEAGYDDSSEDRGIFNLVYTVSPTASLDFEYQHWEREYDKTDRGDYDSDQVMLILDKQFNYLTLEAGGGYHWRDFDKPKRDDEEPLDDENSFTYYFSARVQNPPEDPRSYIEFIARQNFNDEGAYFDAQRFSLEGEHIFMEKIPLNLSAAYQKSDYHSFTGPDSSRNIDDPESYVKRDDDLYIFSGSIGYLMKEWLRFDLSAGYEKRNSNLVGYDYENPYVMLSLDVEYELGRY